MNKLNGLHHLAVCTSDIKTQIEFFTDVLGMELVALYWMHGVPNTFHGFLRMNDESCIALVQNPQIAEEIESRIRAELLPDKTAVEPPAGADEEEASAKV